jgi:hypothetical protein
VTVPLAVVVAPVRVAESLAEPPAGIVDAERVVVIVGLALPTVKVIDTEWNSNPLVAVTSIR